MLIIYRKLVAFIFFDLLITSNAKFVASLCLPLWKLRLANPIAHAVSVKIRFFLISRNLNDLL